ncbi:hypothetical protein [Glaesserella sp.]|uniref:hypothetical protein n=1 Tax=Glaesserella sp. TaxID=2094731 RepID=UPI0035A077FA
MKNSYFILLCCTVHSYANPFYADEKSNESLTEFAKNSPKPTACMLDERLNQLHSPIDFSKLKLVGLSHIHQQYKALFLDENRQLHSFKPNDFLHDSYIQFEHIDLKSVRYIDWQKSKDCQTPYVVTLKL